MWTYLGDIGSIKCEDIFLRGWSSSKVLNYIKCEDIFLRHTVRIMS